MLELKHFPSMFFFFFFLQFRNLDSVLNIFFQKITVIAYVFLNLRTPKNAARQISKKPRFRGPFDK